MEPAKVEDEFEEGEDRDVKVPPFVVVPDKVDDISGVVVFHCRPPKEGDDGSQQPGVKFMPVCFLSGYLPTAFICLVGLRNCWPKRATAK